MMATRQEFYENFKNQLDELNSSAEKLERDLSSAAADVQQKGKEQLGKFQEAKKAAAKKLEEVQAAGSDTWENLKQGAENGMNAVKNALSDIKSIFR